MEAANLYDEWVQAGRDFQSGIDLLGKVSKNRLLARNISRSEKTYSGKLDYELRKACGVGTSATVTVKPVAVSAKGIKPVAAKPSAPVKKADPVIYPPEVEKVKTEYAELYNLRAKQHGLLTEVTPDNAPENIKKRKTLTDSIAQISQRLELLYAAKEAYFEHGTLPDMDSLFAPAQQTQQKADELPNDVAELKKMKYLLLKSITKAKHMLEYQNEAKQKRPNPMPEGPRRLELTLRVEQRTKEVERIEYKLVELAH
jgi:hypothetical protein